VAYAQRQGYVGNKTWAQGAYLTALCSQFSWKGYHCSEFMNHLAQCAEEFGDSNDWLASY